MVDSTPLTRMPTVMANWKMAMTLDESRSFLDAYLQEIDGLIGKIQIIISAPATAISTLAPIVESIPLVDVGAQNSSASSGLDHTGELSAALLADAGAKWCMVGHWDVMRRNRKTDIELNGEVHALIKAGIRPVILLGESASEAEGDPSFLKQFGQLEERMEVILEGLEASDMARSVMIYEPEAAIGSSATADPELVSQRCQWMRNWLVEKFGDSSDTDAGVGCVPILYGGSVFPDNVDKLLASGGLDGFGAGRRGRDAQEFAQITNAVYRAKRR